MYEIEKPAEENINLPDSYESMRYSPRVLCRVALEGFWNGDRVVNRDKVYQVMLEEKERHEGLFPNLPTVSFLDSERETALEDFQTELHTIILDLVEQDVIPQDLLDQIEFSFNTIDFQVTNKTGGTMLVGAERASLFMGTKAIDAFANQLIRLMHLQELGLTNQQILRISIVSLFAHELAHMLEKNIINYAYNKAMQMEEWQKSKDTLLVWDMSFQQETMTQIALIHQEHSTKPFETQNRKVAYALHKEKLATSLQVMALTLGLAHADVSLEQAAILTKEYIDETDKTRNDLSDTYTYMVQSGIPADKIDVVVATLNMIAHNHQLDGFDRFADIQTIGYFTQYSPQELSESLKQVAKQLADGSFIQQIFDQAIKNSMPIVRPITTPQPLATPQ